jgi:hypothetical protein
MTHVDRWHVIWGLRQRHWDPSADARLEYEAEGRTGLNGAAVAAGTAPVSGSGNNVMRSAALTTSYAGVVSTQATAGGNHLRHVGDYRVFARVFVPTSATGMVKVALDWAEGDFRRHTQNTEVTPPVKGAWSLIDLGQVHLTRVLAGTQRWEGRVLAKSTVAGDTIDVDCLILIPVSEGSGQISGVQQFEVPTAFLARDEFDQTAGALTGKTAPVGGAWATAGSATTLAVEVGGHTAQRTLLGDTLWTGGYGISGAAAMTNTVVQTDTLITQTGTGFVVPALQGVIARYIDTNNWLMALITNPFSGPGSAAVTVYKRVTGTVTALGTFAGSGLIPPTLVPRNITIRLYVDTAGRFIVWQGASASALSVVLQGQDAVLATGGALASGKPGIYDEYSSSGGGLGFTRNYDNFFAFAATPDAAIFAGRQLEIRHDRAQRQDSTGALWNQLSRYEGDYIRIPPAGREGRTTEIIVKACRNDPATGPDSGIDDISAQLFYTPRYLVVPD